MQFIWLIFLNFWLIFDGVDGGGGESWCYKGEKCGPGHWPGQCNRGKAQSPIDLHSKSERSPGEEEGSLKFNENYFQIHETFFITNTGHSVNVQLREGARAELEGYIFAQLHFHWGHENFRGSEHTVDSKSYPMEVHLVHYANHHPNLTAALRDSSPRALAVLGIFFQITDEDNLAMESIISNLPLVTHPHVILARGNLNLMGLLPSKLDLWRYEGSLTTPSCDEKVIWTVFQQPIHISERQIQIFRALKDKHGDLLVNNFRPTQSRQGREVKLVKIRKLELIPVTCKETRDIELIVALAILGAVVVIGTLTNIILYRLRLKKSDKTKFPASVLHHVQT